MVLRSVGGGVTYVFVQHLFKKSIKLIQLAWFTWPRGKELHRGAVRSGRGDRQRTHSTQRRVRTAAGPTIG
jgi:hypothetical protein